MFDEIEGNVDGIIPLENVVQYLTIMSQDNRKIKVKVIIGSLLEDYKDVQIDLKKFTVKFKGIWVQILPSNYLKDIIERLIESGWKPYNKDETGSLSEMNIEEVFQLVDINNSGYVTKTVDTKITK